MRQYEVKMHNGDTKFVHASNINQAINRVYLLGDKVEKVRPVFNSGGVGKWVKA